MKERERQGAEEIKRVSTLLERASERAGGRARRELLPCAERTQPKKDRKRHGGVEARAAALRSCQTIPVKVLFWWRLGCPTLLGY